MDLSVTFAICVHKFPEGLALGALLLGEGFRRKQMLWLVAAVESTTILGGLLGWFVLRDVSAVWLALALADACGGSYLALHAMLGEIFRHHKALVLGSFAAGFTIIAALILYFHLKAEDNAQRCEPALTPIAGREKLSALTNRLRRESLKITGPRKAILDLLRKHHHPLTNREILAACAESQCDLATIYRAMHLLQELGVVQQFNFGDGVARFELVGEGCRGHHDHLVCTGCARVVEIEEARRGH